MKVFINELQFGYVASLFKKIKNWLTYIFELSIQMKPKKKKNSTFLQLNCHDNQNIATPLTVFVATHSGLIINNQAYSKASLNPTLSSTLSSSFQLLSKIFF